MKPAAIMQMDRQWSFDPDMNHDGITTISDVWLWGEWLFYYPGDWLIRLINEKFAAVGIFLELTGAAYGGLGSGVTSFVFWVIAFTVMILLNELSKNKLSLKDFLRLIWIFGSFLWGYLIIEVWGDYLPEGMGAALVLPIIIAWFSLYIAFMFIPALKKNE